MEQDKRKCSRCKELRERIQDGRFPNGNNKRWRDEFGKMWSGNVCGECNQVRAKESMKKTRYAKKN